MFTTPLRRHATFTLRVFRHDAAAADFDAAAMPRCRAMMMIT